MNYRAFVAQKLDRSAAQGIADAPLRDSFGLFPHQDALTRWSLRSGRSAIFAATGLGKTAMELVWADRVSASTGLPVLILCPLAVAEQTRLEGQRIGIDVAHAREQAGVGRITVTNYERLHRFDPAAFGGIVLDESSIIKHHDARTFGQLCDAFGSTPFRLCATATPSPNDYMELGTHAEFLGVCTRGEMLSEFFVHDGGETQKWRLKRHARKPFWRFVASWGAMIRTPSDLGFDDAGYRLPDLRVEFHRVEADEETTAAAGMLFALPAATLQERRSARRASSSARARALAERIAAEPDERWIVWCDLNYEADEIRRLIHDAVEVRGSDPIETKEQRLADFSAGKTRVLVTKSTIAGFGLNWQHCARVAFLGLSDSWEQYHQAIRRCWRFGQKRPVQVHCFASDLEGAVLENLRRKEADAEAMARELSAETHDAVIRNVLGKRQKAPAAHDTPRQFPSWLRSDTA